MFVIGKGVRFLGILGSNVTYHIAIPKRMTPHFGKLESREETRMVGYGTPVSGGCF